jgi:hypothetical protein
MRELAGAFWLSVQLRESRFSRCAFNRRHGRLLVQRVEGESLVDAVF